jgi:prolyl oligopeptidase
MLIIAKHKLLHMKHKLIGLGLAATLASCNQPDVEQVAALTYPETAQVDTVDTYFGTDVPDPYRWLEDDQSTETAAWVTAQNKVTHGYLDHITFRDKIKTRLEKLLDYERVYAPTQHGDHYYYYKNDGLQNQNVLYRSEEVGGASEVFLDPNTFREDGTISLGGASFSEDGSLFSYSISEGGSDWRKAIIISTDTKTQVDDTLKHIKFSGMSWKGNEGFYYTQYEEPEEGMELSGVNTNGKVYFHKVGTMQQDDALIFEPDGEQIGAGGGLTENDRFLALSTFKGGSPGNQLFIQDLAGENELVTVIENFENDHNVVDAKGDKVLVRTNLDAPNYRLVAVDLNNPSPENWQDVNSESEPVLNVNTGGGYLFASYLQDAKTAIKQMDYDGKLVREVALPGIGTAYGFGSESEKRDLYYTFTSFTYPPTIFNYDMESGESVLYEQPEVDFNPDDYETKQVFYASKDGTKVPMFITYKKGIELNGKNPTYLYAYGGFNVSLRPSFRTARIVWLANGGIYAQPNLRGGGEYGEDWHEAGTKMQKQNVFDDFIAAGEYLISEGYTSSDYLAIAGGSNGGLLVGATMAQRPGLAKVAFPAVGVMDMLRYHKFTIGWAWASDYGTSEDSKEMFDYLKNYSPIHALKDGVSYPATMVTTADHDDRVVPAHSFKFAATLQEKHVGDNPVLIRIETDAGHGAGTPTSKRIEQGADQYAFAWYNMGVVPPMAKQDQ